MSNSTKQLQKDSWSIFEKEGAAKYYGKNKTYDYLPEISGCPSITVQKTRPYRAKSFYSKQPIMKLKRMPRFCHLRKLINYPFKNWGAPLITFTGNYGTGKSLAKNLLKAFFLARGVRLLEFNDRRFEARNLACHGYYDHNNKFHPFEIEVLVPKDYVFRDSNPIWKYYPNVTLKYWSTAEDIIDCMKAHKMVVVYEECFTDSAKLQLWIELMELLGENLNPNIINMFSHHELARLIPETPTKEIYKTVREASNVAMNLRKDRIGMITTFHIISEVFYRISQKFGYILIKRPVNRKGMTDVERDARSFGVKEVNVSRGGYWMKHKIGYFPELPDLFRLIPQREKLTYPDLNILEDKQATTNNIVLDETDITIITYRDESTRILAGRLGMSQSTIQYRKSKLKKLGLLFEKLPMSEQQSTPTN